jgi:tetratricopeptide (TPR) repeat protein
MLVNYRPEYSHPWSSKSYYTRLRLDPLGRESAEDMLAALMGSGQDLLNLKRLIIDKTEGTPFFIEEICLALIEDAALVRDGARIKLAKSVNQLKIPPTVQGILAERIDRLPGNEKDLLQTLAVIGKEFPLALARKVFNRPDDEMRRMFDDLQRAELIYEQPAMGDIEYTFKHALTREVAYNSVLVERRKVLHERIGTAFESQYANTLDDHVTELAYHYTHSGNATKAVEFCLRACRQTTEHGSFSDAVSHFETGLEILQKLPDDERCAELELELRDVGHLALLTTEGASHRVRESSERAIALCQRTGVNWKKAWSILLTASFAETNRDLPHARKLSTELLERAEAHGSQLHIAVALSRLATALGLAGDFELAAERFERSLALLRSRSETFIPSDLMATAYCTVGTAESALILWLVGYPDRALERIKRTTALGRESRSKLVLGHALFVAMTLYRLCQRLEDARESAEEILALATELGNAAYRAASECELGYDDVMAGDLAAGIARMRHSLPERRRTAAEGGVPLNLAALATVLRQAGQFGDAVRTVNESLQLIETTNERWAEAEVHRLKGELLLAQDPSNKAQAEQSFRIRSTSLANSTRNHGSCARLPSSQGYWQSRPKVTRRVRCSPKSTTGSPRASTPPT